ncbi:MAG: hypothetical protein IKL00_11970 [Oscillospiraceae bacterium]|nr:hypothetical protein [Oscillospiraceae bacterium]
MRFKKTWAMLLAAALAASISACGNQNQNENSESTTENTTEATEDTTAASETETTEENKTNADSVKVYYGWGGSEDEAKYTTEIFCPEGAKFSDHTLKNYEEDGSVMTAEIDDEVNEYSATSNTHWHRDAYSSEPTAYPIIAQLYFDGEIDAETAAENSNCSQKVTPLGFKWNGYDVIMIETTYTFKDYGEQTELFAGVEYDLDYWKVEEGTGEVKDLTTKALFGFDMYSYGFDDLTQDQCAWIAGELFGVDSGIENPFAVEEDTTEAVVNVDKTALVGTWVDLTSDWEDTYIFNADGTGTFISGPEYDFTYEVNGDTLTVTFEEDDIEEYTATVDGSKLVLVDKQFGYEQSFTKSAEDTGTPTEAETEESAGTDEPDSKSEIIGTWKASESGFVEIFTFKADGTGEYSYAYEGEISECGFTYEFFRSDYVDIYYDDNTEGGFEFEIADDKMTVRNEYVDGLVYTRQ